MKTFIFFNIITIASVTLSGSVSLYQLIKGKKTILHFAMIFLGIDVLSIFLFFFNRKTINTIGEFCFYSFTLFWIINTAFFSYWQKLVLWFFSFCFIGISILAYQNILFINYELPLIINYFILCIIHLFNIHTKNNLSKTINLSHYLAFFSFFAYNIVSGLFYALKFNKISSISTYMYTNLAVLCLSCIGWTIALLLPPSPSSEQ